MRIQPIQLQNKNFHILLLSLIYIYIIPKGAAPWMLLWLFDIVPLDPKRSPDPPRWLGWDPKSMFWPHEFQGCSPRVHLEHPGNSWKFLTNCLQPCPVSWGSWVRPPQGGELLLEVASSSRDEDVRLRQKLVTWGPLHGCRGPVLATALPDKERNQMQDAVQTVSENA